jgi:hypothetical protein
VDEEVPFFLTSRLGGLTLGPAAGNLEEVRLGAEFIAGKFDTLVREWDEADNGIW